MNTRFLTVTLAAITACSLGACTVETSGSTNTTATASASATGTGGRSSEATGTGGAGGAATGVGGSGGAGGDSTACDPAYTCAEAITPNTGNPAKLCDGPAEMLFTAVSQCTCSGACAMACADSACVIKEPSTPCKICLTNTATGCGKEFDACTNG